MFTCCWVHPEAGERGNCYSVVQLNRAALPQYRAVERGVQPLVWMSWQPHVLTKFCRFCWINASQFIIIPLINLYRFWMTVFDILTNFIKCISEKEVSRSTSHNHSRKFHFWLLIFFFVFPIYFSLLVLLKPSSGFTKLIFPFIYFFHPPPPLFFNQLWSYSLYTSYLGI